jgi:hypothetical protein
MKSHVCEIATEKHENFFISKIIHKIYVCVCFRDARSHSNGIINPINKIYILINYEDFVWVKSLKSKKVQKENFHGVH